MKQELEQYQRLEGDLLRQIDLCNASLQRMNVTLKTLAQQYQQGQITELIYNTQLKEFLKDKSIEGWYHYYHNNLVEYEKELASCRQYLQEFTADPKQKKSSLLPISIWLFMVVLTGTLFLTNIDSPITGFFGIDSKLSIVAEDGASAEGFLWTNINGSGMYERCMQVTPTKAFNAVRVIAKVSSAVDKKHLVLKLYQQNKEQDEPGEIINSCKVGSYGAIWKDCLIKTKAQNAGIYWVCASSKEGNEDESYYLLDYKIGGERKTTLWNGNAWQKLSGITYTLKAQFMNNEQ